MLLLAQNLSRERNPLTPAYSSRRQRDSWESVMSSFSIFSHVIFLPGLPSSMSVKKLSRWYVVVECVNTV